MRLKQNMLELPAGVLTTRRVFQGILGRVAAMSGSKEELRKVNPNKVRLVCEEHGLSLANLASRAGIDRKTLKRVLSSAVRPSTLLNTKRKKFQQATRSQHRTSPNRPNLAPDN